MSIKMSFACLALMGMVGAAGSALAQTNDDPDQISIRVSYADLNLSSRAGAEALLGRIKNAAESICLVEPEADLTQRMLHTHCMTSTVGAAVVGMHNPLLMALYAGKPVPTQTLLAANIK